MYKMNWAHVSSITKYVAVTSFFLNTQTCIYVHIHVHEVTWLFRLDKIETQTT